MSTNLEQTLSDAILKSVDIIVDKKLSELEYNTTINGQIVDDSKSKNGIYTVKYETSTFVAYSSDISLVNGDIVQVLISNNNSSDTRIILNKVISEETQPYDFNENFKNFLDMTGNLTDVILNTSKSLIANNDIEENILWQYSDIKELQNYTQIKLEADFQTFLSNAVVGNFGLRLEIITDTEILNFYFTNNEMIGDAYNYASFTKQKKIFDLSKLNIKEINSISLYFYQEKDSFLDKSNMPLSSIDSLGNKMPANIFVNNVNLSFGYNINDFTPGLDIATISLIKGEPETFNESIESISAELSWIHWNEEKTAIIPKEEILQENTYHIEWYQYQKYSDAVQFIQTQRANREGPFTLNASEEHFDLLEENLISSLGCPYINNNNWQHLSEYDDQFQCSFLVNADSMVEESIRAFIVDNDTGTVIESNVLTVKNENVPNNTNNINKKQGIYLTPLDGLNGSYYLYTESGIINNENNKTRILEVSYYNTEGEQIDLIEEDNYTIRWGEFPQENTMLASCEIGAKPTELIYSIKDTYEPTAINNTISCTITYKNGEFGYNDHVATQDFQFGYSNVSNADTTLVIKQIPSTLTSGNIRYTNNAVLAGTKEAQFCINKYDSTGKIVELTENDEIIWALQSYDYNDENAELIEEKDNIILIAENNTVTLKCDTGFNFNYLLFLSCSYNKTIVKYPIAITADNIHYNHISGATSVIYQSFGPPIYNKESYQLYDYNCNLNNLENYEWSLLGEKWFKLIENENTLNPPQSYLSNNNIPSGIVYKNKNGDIAWLQPIVVMQTQFSSTTLNKWDGASILQDEENGTIAAPRLASGKKEDGNFTGVVLGDWFDEGEKHYQYTFPGQFTPNEDNQIFGSCTGLYGFKKGQAVFGFRDSGTAFIGKNNGAQILFDGNNSFLTSSSYMENSNGLFMDLDDSVFIASRKIEASDNSSILQHIMIDASEKSEYPLQIGNNTNETFKINWDGTGEFSGTIHANSGDIGGWKISENGLEYRNETDEDNIQNYLLKTKLDESETISVQFGSNFYVTKYGNVLVRGEVYADKGNIGGWKISENGFEYKNKTDEDNVQDYLLKTKLNDPTDIAVQFGENFVITGNGIVSTNNIIIGGTSQLNGPINGLFKLVQVSFGFSFGKGVAKTVKFSKNFSKDESLKEYSLVGITGVYHNASKSYVKISQMSFNPKDKTVSVYLSKHNYSKAIKKKKGIISLLFLKSSAELINIEDPSDIDGEEDDLDGEEIEIPVISNPSEEGGTAQEAINFNEHLTTYASSTKYGHVKIQGCNEEPNYVKLENGVLTFDNSVITKINNHIGGANTNITQIKNQIKTLNSKVENIETDLSNLTTDLSSLTGEVNNLTIDLGNLTTKVNNLIEKVDSYHSE